ncbi:MAG: DNA (cytosine-5-)-methyltransferase [Proteobacteria bacterium]|jgi:DNA (cytosine-5)-methyltransferase 1|nr:DNA (cytosine-5-)-methyltransferase [Pseudomonadota bacterium]
MKKKRKIIAIDLFCGAGGLTYGLQKAGLKVVAGFDIDSACEYPYEKNNKSQFIHADVKKITGNDLNKLYANADIKILTGCAPCQPFSTYSKLKGTDEKWILLRSFLRLASESLPDIISMENVPQLVRHKVFKEFLKGLIRLGYAIWYKEVDCSEYGVPQTRKRLVLLASKLGAIGPLKNPHKNLKLTVRENIKDLEPLKAGSSSNIDPLHSAAKLSPLNLKRIKASTPGGSWKEWDPSLIADCHKKDTGKTFASVYGRMEWDTLAPTITTQCYGFGNGRFGHPEQDRAISLREAAILQTFPEDYHFIEKTEKLKSTVIGRLIGNAVPVKLAEAIGYTIKNHIKYSCF